MVYDPNSTIATAFEARVTMRGVRLTPDGSPVQVSTRSDFIAPELSSPSTLALELDKGKRGWTDYDAELPAQAVNGGVIVGRAERELAQFTAGTTVIRRAPRNLRVVHRTGPRPGRR